MFHYVWIFIIGILAGALARGLLPGSQQMSLFMTGMLGIVGSFVGGYLARIFSKPAPGALFHPAGFVMSVIGALVVLFAWFRLR